MVSQSREQQKQLFRRELHLLKEKEYISVQQYEETLNAHVQFYADIEAEQEKNMLVSSKENPVLQKPVSPVKKVEKKKLSAEEMRERNISWSLNIGVILLLIGGLFVATSNWETMENWMKSGTIAFVSLLFYGMAYVSKRMLRIERTSFAFIVLGSLFLPIFILSIGWFELLGPYLSFYGEGRYILGMLGSFLLVPIYGLFARKLRSRLFVWFSFIALTAGADYFFAAFQLERDGFYLCMTLFNIGIVASYHWLKKLEKFEFFSKELVYFSQFNLILSTFLMLVFFNNHVFYSVNILLTAAVYLSIVYVSGRKEYHYAFSVMIVYGVYQLVEHSILDSFGPVIYALVGIGFLAVPKVMSGEGYWEKIFRFTSAAVSCLAFLYVSVVGILLHMSEPSFALFLAYMIIAIQFTYLAKVMENGLFSYLSPVFLASALYEIALAVEPFFRLETMTIPIFIIGFLICLCIGYWLKHPMIKTVVNSSRDVGMIIMILAIFMGLVHYAWFNVGFMLLLLSVGLAVADRLETRQEYIVVIPWAIPLTIGFALLSFGEEMRTSLSFYRNNLGLPMNAVLSSAVLIFMHYLWKIKEKVVLARNSFYLAQVFYTIAILEVSIFQINGVWMRPAVLLAGVGMYVAFYKFTKFKWVPYLTALVAMVAYFSVLSAIRLKGSVPEFFSWIQFPFGAFLLLAVAYFLIKKDLVLAKGFAWVGHVFLPLLLLMSSIVYQEQAFWSLGASVIVYWISSRLTAREWKVMLFLYSSFFTLFIVIVNRIFDLFGGEYEKYSFIITSSFVFIYWLLANKADRKRTVYFLVPFSLIGIAVFIASGLFGWLSFVAMTIYAIGLIAFLHMIKKDIFIGLPLLLLFAGTLSFLFMSGMGTSDKLLIVGGFGVGLTLCGQFFYRYLIEGNMKKIDSYSLAALLFFLSMYVFQTDRVWIQVMPGLFISCLLFMQRKRIHSAYAWIPLFLSGVYLLQPYYTILGSIAIPDLIEKEVYVLPFVAVIIFARLCLKDRYRSITGYIQWGVLVAVSLVLIVDAHASSTVYDALIIGTLALISMISGMFLRVKSYFFVGSGVLLLNVLLQTRPFWGNMPWWAYLLIAGSILITVASYHEWNKQKTTKGEKTFLSKIKQNILTKLNDWE
ncbi:hypothetical protein F7731_09955 [Cytobacillus depressus]|uniref:DUF2157 domain-containing protein n=1 Tax=Cytobacillus depressus TaxID=1602942 RepID=A0A6L3V610_9BACI|nr:hypothetical protein [Cytobacillus depressus]KAB2336676.1 hypothetical protein F7731_09955 [Cytobacillus depressus]